MMVCLLDAHRERSQELHYEIPTTTISTIPTTTYLDIFGNTVRRFMAPPGDLTIMSDAVIKDSGLSIRLNWTRASILSNDCRTKLCRFCSAAAIAKPTSSPTSLGVISDQARAAGAEFRRSAILSAVI